MIRRRRTKPATRVDLEDRLGSLVERFGRSRRVPHVVLGVAQGGGSLLWAGAAGPAGPGRPPLTPETPYFIASVTKLFIATAVLQLHEEGEVDLDGRMQDYLPHALVGGLHRIGSVDHTPAITIRHLLSHTSGLPDYLEDRPKGGQSLYRALADGEDRSWTLEDVVTITRSIGPHFPPRDLTAARQRARYSDTNFQLLIAVIEAVAGEPLHRVFEERLFRPLNLNHTFLPGTSEPLGPLDREPATLWSRSRPLHLPGALRSANDLYSTVGDNVRFLSALTRGEVFRQPSTFTMMGARWNRMFYPLRYGLGMMRYRIGRPFGPGGRAVTLIGHSGATGPWLFHCPELDVVLAGTVDEIHARSLPFRFMPRVLRQLVR